MKRKNYEEYKIKKNKYYMITIIIMIIFVAFEIICNFEYFLNLMRGGQQTDGINWNTVREHAFAQEPSQTDTENKDAERKKSNYPEDSIDCYVLADEEHAAAAEDCCNLLERQKRAWMKIERVTEVPEKNGIIVFVIKESILEEEAEALDKIAKSQNSVVFLALPNEESLGRKEVRELLGIYRYREKKIHRGLRFIPSFFVTDELMQLERLKIEMYDCNLQQKTKTYAYTLLNDDGTEYEEEEEEYGEEEDAKEAKPEGEEEEKVNEKLPPVIWRNSLKTGYVYVVNGNFEELSCMPGVITAILGKIIEDDIYPVINGYSVVVRGLPYIRQNEISRIEELYSRDAMGLQQDILFPALISSLKKNQYIPTFFAGLGEYEGAIEPYIQKQMDYMEKEIVASSGEIGLMYEGKETWRRELAVGKSLFDSGEYELTEQIQQKFETIVSMDADTGHLIDRTCETVWIPVVRQDIFNKERERLKELACVTECGMLTTLIDIESVLTEDSEKYNWVNYNRQCESALGAQNEYYSDLSKVTVEQLAGKILLYRMMEPVITKAEDKITIDIGNFQGEACFMLRTEKKIVGIEQGTYVVIGSNAYLIEATGANVEIYLEREEEAL